MMTDVRPVDDRQRWEASFEEQIQLDAYNTAAVEALVRNVSYYLRARVPPGRRGHLHFLEMGCGAGPNLLWLAQKGIKVSGIDIAPTALGLARRTLEGAGYRDRIGELHEGTVTALPFADASVDGILESCVFQHLAREDRARAFAEVRRCLRPGGLFAGYMLDRGHSVFQAHTQEVLASDPGTLMLAAGSSKIHLTNIGLSHFFGRDEFARLLDGFTIVDPCLTTYDLPEEEARRRGFATYRQSMWAVFAVK